MDRKKTLLKAFQRGHLLNLKNKMYRSWIEKFIVGETKGDIGTGDITSNAVIKKDKKGKAVIFSREQGIAAGIEEASFLFSQNGIKVKQLKKDGQSMKKKDKLMILEGREKDLLKMERSGLDILQRMSGIATLTYDLIRKVKSRIAIAPTRKTHWRYMDKKAVYAGKGLTHRLALWESVLIKDNHLAALKREGVKDVITTALERAVNQKSAKFIEIEVQTKQEAIKAAKKFRELKIKKPCLIMLDNMNPKQIRDAIRELKKRKLYDSALIEISGGITPENIEDYSKTGADVMSLGYLTKSSRSLDIKQQIVSK